jgi:hypothetical protein
MNSPCCRTLLPLLAAMLILSPLRAAEPLQIKSGEVQLFVDDYLIDSQTDLKRTLRQPKKDNGGDKPVIALEGEYGNYSGTHQANGTIVYDPRLKKYVMFALGYSSHYPVTPAKDRVRIYRLTSPDGMNWIKGDDGKPQHIKIDQVHPQTKVVTNTDLASFCYDEKDAEYPYKGWVYFAHWGDPYDGVYYIQSKDGIQWERGPHVMGARGRVLKQDGHTVKGPGDVTIFSPDPLTGRYLALTKFSRLEEPGIDNSRSGDNRLRARAFLFVDRLDEPIDLERIERVGLLPSAAEANGDLPLDEYYSSTAWRYGSLWLGGLKIWHGKAEYPYSAAGCTFMKLVCSRDGLNWKRVPYTNDSGVPEVFVPAGKEGGNGGKNDGGYMTEFSNPPLRIGDELIYYYGSSSYGKLHPDNIRVSGGGIFRARLRIDGFVSVDGGTFTTKPLAFDGRGLSVNGIGPIKGEVLDAKGAELAEATLQGDSLKHDVNFGGRSLRDVAGGGAVSLRFTVDPDAQAGQLYSFTIQP